MTTIGIPTMTEAQEAAWVKKHTRPGAGGLKKADHVWKTAPSTRLGKKRPQKPPDGRTPCLPGEAHHWHIPEPDGRHRLPGACSKCGATREFAVTDEEWGDWSAQRDNSWDGMYRRRDDENWGGDGI